jgi:hypothetical protein
VRLGLVGICMSGILQCVVMVLNAILRTGSLCISHGQSALDSGCVDGCGINDCLAGVGANNELVIIVP